MKGKKIAVRLALPALLFAAFTIWDSNSSDAQEIEIGIEAQTINVPLDVQQDDAEPMTCTEKLKYCCSGYYACRKDGHIQECDNIWNSCNKEECSGSAAFNCKC